MRLSLEIVPHSDKKTLDELKLISTKYDYFDTINIPDIKHLQTNCLETVKLIKNSQKKFSVIPHIVTGNYRDENLHELIDYIITLQLPEILIVRGDYSNNNSFDTITLAKKLSKEIPQLKLYAAIDPYRQNIEQEIKYIQEKKAAGIKGFFTQPFFDLSLFKAYSNLLKEENVFWGISPVITEKSYNYWIKQNNAIFPADFELNLDWNINFYHKVKKITEKSKSHHLYLMPIKIDLNNYLNHIFHENYV